MKINFTAILLSKTNINTSNYTSYEECILLINAINEEEAIKKAEDYGRSLETSYINHKKEAIIISFVKIISIQETLRETFDENGIWELQSNTFYNIDAYNKIDE
jgi:Domain of unknown function (DUF4288)